MNWDDSTQILKFLPWLLNECKMLHKLLVVLPKNPFLSFVPKITIKKVVLVATPVDDMVLVVVRCPCWKQKSWWRGKWGEMRAKRPADVFPIFFSRFIYISIIILMHCFTSTTTTPQSKLSVVCFIWHQKTALCQISVNFSHAFLTINK